MISATTQLVDFYSSITANTPEKQCAYDVVLEGISSGAWAPDIAKIRAVDEGDAKATQAARKVLKALEQLPGSFFRLASNRVQQV